MNVLKVLNDEGQKLEEFVKKYRLVNIPHPDLPLNVLNYSVKSPKFDVVSRECRSLILSHEIVSNKPVYHLAGKGFDRFFDLNELSKKKYLEFGFDFESCTATTKEDGSLMVFYNFDGKWRINTRYNYSAGKFSSGVYQKSTGGENPNKSVDENMTYQKLFEKIITHDHSKDFEKIVSVLDPTTSYIFEMCSPQYNRIVKSYESIRLYLLSSIRIVESENFIEEMPIEYSQEIARKIGVLFPDAIKIRSLEDAKQHILEKMRNDPSMEGLVLRDKNNKRLKVKNPGYLFLHNIRYDRLIEPQVKDIIHFVLHCEEKRFFEVIEDLCKTTYNETLKLQILQKFSEVQKVVMEGYALFKVNCEKFKDIPIEKSHEIRKLLSTLKLRKMISDYLKIRNNKGDDEEVEGEEEEEEDLFLKEESLWNHYKKYSSYIMNCLFPKTSRKKGNSQTTRTMKLTELKGCSVNLDLYRQISIKYLPKSKHENFDNTARRYSKMTKFEQKYFGVVKKRWRAEFNPSDPSTFFWELEDGQALLSQVENDGLAQVVPKEREGEKGIWDVFCYCGKKMTLFVIPVKERLYKCIRESCQHCLKPKFYRSKYNAVYRCESCGIQHGCYQADVNRYTSSGVLQRSFPAKPFGIPCSSLTLVLRHFAHEVFDTLYQEKRMTRPRAYEKLGELLGLEPKNVHVGLFPISTCIKTVQVMMAFKKKNGW